MKIFSVEFVKSSARQAEFKGGLSGGEFIATMAGEEMPDDRQGQAFDQL